MLAVLAAFFAAAFSFAAFMRSALDGIVTEYRDVCLSNHPLPNMFVSCGLNAELRPVPSRPDNAVS